MTSYYGDDSPKEMTPASERLLLALSRSDKGEGVNMRYLSRGRYHWDGLRGAPFNRRTFRLLYDRGLVTGWNTEDSDGPARLTEKGAEYAARLDAKDTERRNRPGKKPDAEAPAAQRALTALAKFDGPTLLRTGERRGIARLGDRDGFTAREATFYALVDAGYAAVTRGDFLARRITITDAGRERLERSR